VAAGGEVEGHVLVGLLRVRAAVGVPDVHALAVLHEGAEALAEPVDVLAHVQRELLVDVRALALDLRVADRALGRAGEQLAVPEVVGVPRTAQRHPGGEPARGELDGLRLGVPGDGGGDGGGLELEAGPRLPASGEVLDLHGDHIGPRRGERDGDDRLVQRVATAEDPRDRGVDDQLVLADLDVVHLRRALQRDAVADQPVAVGELHGGPPEVGRDQGRRTRSPRSASGPARRTRTRPVGRSPSATTRWGRGGAGSGAADGVGASSSAVPTAAAWSAPGSGAVSRAVTSVPAGRTNSAVPPASVRGRSSVPSSSEAGAKRCWSRCSARYAGTISSRSEEHTSE